MDADCVEVIDVQKDFKSLTAKVDIPKGTFLADFRGKATKEKTRHSVHVDLGVHIECIGASKYTNHSCTPNASLVFHERIVALAEELSILGLRLSWHIVACRDIRKGEYITIDYNLIEYTLAEEFDCICKSPNCVGKVQGFKFLSMEEKDKRLPFLSPVVKRIRFENENDADE